MTAIERGMLWLMSIAVIFVALAGWAVYQDVVKPLFELRQKVEKIENLINKLPLPFREGEGEKATI